MTIMVRFRLGALQEHWSFSQDHVLGVLQNFTYKLIRGLKFAVFYFKMIVYKKKQLIVDWISRCGEGGIYWTNTFLMLFSTLHIFKTLRCTYLTLFSICQTRINLRSVFGITHHVWYMGKRFISFLMTKGSEIIVINITLTYRLNRIVKTSCISVY